MILGVDFGSSFTDAVLMDGERVKKAISFGVDERLDLVLFKFAGERIEEIAVTGAYGKKYDYDLNDIKVRQVNEIDAIGLGGLYAGKIKEALVVSVGSGTAMVSCSKKIRHIGGTAIGGRTLIGLSKLLTGVEDLGKIEGMANEGDLSKIDLQIKDIYPNGIGVIPPSGTASHFGKVTLHRREDIALALINMIAQNIGTLAVFGARSLGHKNIVLTGRLPRMKIFKDIITERINTLSNIPVEVPELAEHATAIGAVIGLSIGL